MQQYTELLEMTPGRLMCRKILCILVLALFAYGGCKRAGNLWLDESTGDPNTKRFINRRENLTGPLAEHYVDFSFNYPSSWVQDPTTGRPGSQNFVTVEKKTADDDVIESFAVGHFNLSGSGSGVMVEGLLKALAGQLSDQFSRGLRNYKKVSEGTTQVGPYNGYEFRFAGKYENGEDLWGRTILVPNPKGGGNGATLLMLATPKAEGVRGVEDLGVKGETSLILKSLNINW